MPEGEETTQSKSDLELLVQVQNLSSGEAVPEKMAEAVPMEKLLKKSAPSTNTEKIVVIQESFCQIVTVTDHNKKGNLAAGSSEKGQGGKGKEIEVWALAIRKPIAIKNENSPKGKNSDQTSVSTKQKKNEHNTSPQCKT